MDANDKYKKIFSKNLNYYMNLKGKSQSDIIIDLKINKSAISSWCNGTRLPRMDKVELLANYFNINVSDLIGNSYSDTNYFEYIAEDDAMYPIIDIGDIAFIYKQNHIENGTTFLIKLDNRNTIRKIIENKDKGTYKLEATNARYRPLELSLEEMKNIEILGKVIGAENRSAFN